MSFPAAKALAWEFDLLPIVNSKKQLLGVVFREDLELLVYGHTLPEDSSTEVEGVDSLPLEDNEKGNRTDKPDSSEQDKFNLYCDGLENTEDVAALERTLLLRRTGLVVYSEKMMKLVDLAIRIAQVDSTVLISGESGVGKELMAKLIHDQSPRSLGPFIKINCGAIPENLLESELFGYEAGAFTGASKQGKLGIFELASSGTLFLDEIGELPLSLQVKLLRAIQEQEFVRVGGVKPRKVDIRFIAATNRDLEQMMKEGRFRDDLYYRLNVIPMLIPSLRERKEDILPLVHHFEQKLTQKFKMEKRFAPAVLRVFLNYPWAGNVRELENIIERLFVTSPEQLIRLEHLPEKLLAIKEENKPARLIPLKEAMEQVEQRLIEDALGVYGNTYKAAEALGIDQSTLIRKKAKYKKRSL
jgi:transcriptional regulator with PAS, ATPase and Fis domain